MKPLIAPSILSADMGRLAEEVREVKAAGADMIHIDVMDGHFVPNLAMGPKIVSAVRRYSDLTLDVHLMISHPLDYIEAFASAGADMISFHLEATHTPVRVMEGIRALGVKAGIVLAPGTPVSLLNELLDELDYILLLCVEPGFGNQSFRRPVLSKIRELKGLLEARGASVPVQVDGGINRDTIRDAAAAGAEIFVVGSAVFDQDDYRAEIAGLRNQLKDL